MFINHNQNPEKESVKITVGRLLVVSGLAPLSQRGGRTDAISRPGLQTHLANQRQAGRTRGPMGGQGEVGVHIPGYGAPRNEQWAKMMEVKKRVGYLRSNICNTFVLLSQIAWKATITIILFLAFKSFFWGNNWSMNRKLKDEWLYEILMRRCKILVTCFP